MFAGKTATSNKINAHAANLVNFGTSNKTPKIISIAPLNSTKNNGAGKTGGIIER